MECITIKLTESTDESLDLSRIKVEITGVDLSSVQKAKDLSDLERCFKIIWSSLQEGILRHNDYVRDGVDRIGNPIDKPLKCTPDLRLIVNDYD